MQRGNEPEQDFVKVPRSFFEAGELSPTERHVLFYLAYHGYTADRCYPSAQRLADESGMSRATVNRAIKALKEKGYITIESRSKGKRHLSNGYNLNYGQKNSASGLGKPETVPKTSKVELSNQNSKGRESRCQAKNRFINFHQREYDFAELEERLQTRQED